MSDKDNVAQHLAAIHYDIEPGICKIFGFGDAGNLHSPLDWTFYPPQFLVQRAGRTFLNRSQPRPDAWHVDIDPVTFQNRERA